jgi:8-oxo-dGTP diphosphatase
MLEVKFYDQIEDSLFRFAVIIAKYRGKWVFCKHKERDTYECPGGHRDNNEPILSTAKRELYEETGALEYSIRPICVYSVLGDDGVIVNQKESYGMLYYADIKSFGELPDMEMERVEFFDELPENWTYPNIQPLLFEKVSGLLGL